MRSKSIGGGRARLSKLPPQPSAMAFSYLGQPSDSEAHPDCSLNDILVNEVNHDGPCNIVPETSSDSDDGRRCDDLAPNSNGNMVVVAEKSCVLGLQGIGGHDNCLEMDWTEKEVCIKCDKGGKVLVCSDSSCPLAVHEECMRCSAWFDGMGNFYCPYCSYKRAMLETRKARKKAMLAKKALSGFLDKGMMDGDPLKQKAERVRRTEPNPSTFVRDIEHDGTKNMLDGNEVDKRFAQIEKDQQEERFHPECTINILPYNGAEALATNEQNDVVLSRCGDNARPDDGGQHSIVIGQQMHPGPIIASGGSGSACCREEETRDQFEIVQVGKSVQVEHPRLVDDHQNERVVQDEQQAGPLHASLVEEETTLDGAIHISTKGGLDNAETVKENGSRRPEEEEMQEQEQGTTESSSGGDYMQQEHARASASFHGDSGAVSPNWKRVKKKNQNVVQPPSVDNPRRSARKLSFELNTNVVNEETKNAASKSRQRLTNPTFPNAKRKKLPWTAEEEEMLKEGVQKFSTMVNKNIPWRKILEFGHHVFDGTRTPVDLKDKWRNILVKECLTK